MANSLVYQRERICKSTNLVGIMDRDKSLRFYQFRSRYSVHQKTDFDIMAGRVTDTFYVFTALSRIDRRCIKIEQYMYHLEEKKSSM